MNDILIAVLVCLLLTFLVWLAQVLILFIHTISDKDCRDNITYVRDIFKQMNFMNRMTYFNAMYFPFVGLMIAAIWHGSSFFKFLGISYMFKTIGKRVHNLYTKFMNLEIRK